MKLKLNADLGGKKKGDIIDIATDSEGVILDQYWRRRLKDSIIDNCVERVIATSKINKTKEKK